MVVAKSRNFELYIHGSSLWTCTRTHVHRSWAFSATIFDTLRWLHAWHERFAPVTWRLTRRSWALRARRVMTRDTTFWVTSWGGVKRYPDIKLGSCWNGVSNYSVVCPGFWHMIFYWTISPQTRNQLIRSHLLSVCTRAYGDSYVT